MKKVYIYIAVPALVLLSLMVYLLLAGRADAAAVREEVVRFHIVAHSDEAADQQLKIKVRDGVFALVKELFADCTDQQEALRVAEENRDRLTAEAERILRAGGSEAPVTVEVGERWFPTKDYGTLSFPAGDYRAVSIRIGAAEGENFWCVLYPALCVAPAVEGDTAAGEMTAVVGEEATSFLQREDTTQKIKFALVEWFEHFFQNYLKF